MLLLCNCWRFFNNTLIDYFWILWICLAFINFSWRCHCNFCRNCCNFSFDLKKIIAYSTCSQLGYMFFSCGLSNYYIAFFHLWNHAFFKALLFLSAGAVIHAFFDEQDMRRLNRLREMLPFIYWCFWIGSLAIMGFPFLTGFYSKDLILEFAYSRFIVDANFIYFLGLWQQCVQQFIRFACYILYFWIIML